MSLPEYQEARSISIFMSMPTGEINTRHLLKHALSHGKKVFIPYIYRLAEPKEGLPASIMDMLHLSSVEDMASLKPDKWGIPSIPKSSVTERINCLGGTGLSNGELPKHDDAAGLDLIVMPSMAFDVEMNRLGHGKGYYDNFITRACSESQRYSQGKEKPLLGMSYVFAFHKVPQTTIAVVPEILMRVTVGFALAEQLLPSSYRLPTEAWDWKVDAVVVGSADSDAEARLVLPQK